MVLSIHICALSLSTAFSNVVNYNYGYSTHGRQVNMSIKNCNMAVRGENRSTLKTVPVPFHSTWNALELNLSCGEKPATTALAMEQRIHTSILDYQTSLQKPQLYNSVNHGTRTVVTIFCADGHGKDHKVVCKEGLFFFGTTAQRGPRPPHCSGF